MEDAQRSGFPYGDILSPNDTWSPAPLTPFTPAPVDPHHDKDTTSTSTSTSDTTSLFGVQGQMFNSGGNMNPPSTQPKEMHQLLSMFNLPIQSMGPFASTLVGNNDGETPDLHQLVSMYPHMFTPAAQVGTSTPSQLSSNLISHLPPLPQSVSLMETHQLITKYMQQNNNPSSTPNPSTPSFPTPRTPAPITPASNPTSSSTTTSETSTQALHQLRHVMKKTYPEPTTPAPSEHKSSSRKSSKSRKKVVEEDEEEEEEMGPPPKRKKGEKEEPPPRVHKLLKHRAIDAKSRNRLASAFESLRSFVDVDHKMDKASLLMAATNLMRDMQKEMDEIKHKLTQETTKRQALEIAITATPAAGETLSNVRLPNELPLPFFRNLFMDATVQMVVLNLQRQCVEANDAFLKRHGWTREELIGKVIPSASKLIPALGNLYDPNLPFDFAPIKAGYPKNMTAAHLNPYPATILGLQKLFTQQEKSVTVVHRFINGRGQLIEGRVTHWLVLDGGKPQYTVGCTTDESVITLLE